MTPDSKWRLVRRVLIGIVSLAALLAAGIGGAYALDTRGEPTTVRGLIIAGELAGDLNEAELGSVIADLRQRVEAREVRIDLPDGPRLLEAGEVGITLDSDGLERAALEVGKTGSTLDRIRAWLASFTSQRTVHFALSFDPEQAADVIAGFDGLVVEEPIEPRLVLGSDQRLVVREGTDGRRVYEEAIVVRLAEQVAGGGSLQVEAATIPLAPDIDEEDLQTVADELNVLTEGGVTIQVGDERRSLAASALRVRLEIGNHEGLPNPSFDLDSLQRLIEHLFGDLALGGTDPVFDVVDDEPVVVEPGEPPMECCREDAAAEVAEAIVSDRPGPVVVEPRESEDPRLVEWAMGEDVVEKVAEFTTEHSCCQGRVDNIQRFADIVRGVYLTPGESLSLNEHVGERTTEKGFVPAGTILAGHLVPTVGGGVSQFATTMFNAAFFAGFDFISYQSHSIYFSRYPYGREATISWPLPDLEFENTTDHPALIWTSYTDTSITVSIYSTPSVEVEQTDQEVSPARQCTRVDTFRLRTYSDGREVEDSVFATYRPAEGLDCNGNPTERPDQ